MKEKIKKIFRIIFTIIALLWILDEITFQPYYSDPDIVVIIGIFIMWGILMYSLKEKEITKI